MPVKYSENTDLVVHHAYKVGEGDLLAMCITKSHGTPILYWSDGIGFFFEQVPPIMNPKIEEDFINGKDHWAEVFYADMKNYTETIEISEGEFKGAKVRVVNASKFMPHSDFAKWAKSRK